MIHLNEGQRNVANQFRAVLDSIKDRAVGAEREDRPDPVQFLIGGYAGTGKTTSMEEVASIAREFVKENWPKGKVRLAAPTNKAARKLREKTGHETSTLHWLLGSSPKIWQTGHLPRLERLLEEISDAPDTEKAKARRKHLESIYEALKELVKIEELLDADPHPDERLKAESRWQQLETTLTDFPIADGINIHGGDIIISDESSMVSGELRDAILERKPAVVVWVGDPGQLDPVKAKRWFSPPPQTTLTQVMRQGADSGILKLATLIRQGNANTRMLAEQVKSPDVEFIFPSGEFSVERLVSEYGDRWLSWRNGFTTRKHPYHTKNLNQIYRQAIGRQGPQPVKGDLLYVSGRFANSCRKVWLNKGDDVRVVSMVEPRRDPDAWTLNRCPAFETGMEKKHIRGVDKIERGDCVCDDIEASTGIPPVACSGGGVDDMGKIQATYAIWKKEECADHPWLAIEHLTQSLGAVVEAESGRKFQTLLDPRLLLWDEAQQNAIWRMDKSFNDRCGGNLATSKSPLRAVLQATYGYCISVHQAQGSEYDAITVWYDRAMLKANPDNAVRWLYTAVTRARKRVCIVTI